MWKENTDKKLKKREIKFNNLFLIKFFLQLAQIFSD
jgi:hypothetical protein